MNLTISRKLLALNLLIGGLVIALMTLQLFNMKGVIEDDRKALIRTQVESAVSIASHYAARADAGEISQEEAKTAAASAIASIRYGDGDYLFAYDDEGINIAHPKTTLNGTDMWGVTDPNGVMVVQELITKSKAGGGFFEYMWPRNGGDEPFAKLSYSAQVPAWGWHVGTGVYIDDLSAQFRSEAMIMVGALAVVLLALVGVGLGFSRSVSRPLAGLADVLERIRNGEVDEEVEAAKRQDEIGVIASRIDDLRLSLVEKKALEAEQAQLRVEAEADRKRRAADEQRQAEEREELRLTEERREAEKLAAEKAASAREEADRIAREAEQDSVVRSLAAGLKSLSAGDLSVSISDAFPVAYEQLRKDFNETVGSLSGLIRSITDSAGSIRASVDEITGASNDLSRRTETTAATLEETAAALNELTASVGSAAEGARQADALVKNANDKARTSTEVVDETIAAMGKIESSSSQIAKIIDVIDDIAFQTNLLALNAGVEAARAGDAGRGFAVVASEVRGLAQRSSEAAREISALISESGNHVKHGVDLVGRAGDALQSIATSIADISSHVSEIATSANEQATGINEINAAVTQLDQSTQQNVAMFEETTAASAVLNQETERLSDLIAGFRTSVHDEDMNQVGRAA